jgi:hypothetical protein
MMHDMKKWAQAYLDGLTTSKEFLGQIINAVGKEYQTVGEDDDSDEAIELAKALIVGID